MAITTQQFNKLATKKDLKKDLKELRQESKKDIAGLKSDLNRLEEKMDSKFDAAKNNLDEFREETNNKFNAAFEMFASKEDIKELEKRVASKEDINRLFILMDSIVVKHQENEAERTANIGAHDRIKEDIAKTNKRVTIVEKKLEAVSVVA